MVELTSNEQIPFFFFAAALLRQSLCACLCVFLSMSVKHTHIHTKKKKEEQNTHTHKSKKKKKEKRNVHRFLSAGQLRELFLAVTILVRGAHTQKENLKIRL